jgi:hypothetical protein
VSSWLALSLGIGFALVCLIYVFVFAIAITAVRWRRENRGSRGDDGHSRGHHAGMTLPPDQPPPAKPTRQARMTDRLKTIRLRMAIGQALDDRGITTPAAIGQALGMPAKEATSLLTRHQWREGDVALLEAAAARLGVRVPDHSRPGT